MPTIFTPTDIVDPWFSGDLVATGPRSTKAAAKTEPARNEWPAVTIGRPQCWDLAELASAKGTQLPAELRLLLDASDFRLLQLAFSFHPKRGTQVNWARFEVGLDLGEGSASAVAYDVYPKEVTKRVDRNVKLTISPSLKLAGAEASLGSLTTDIAMAKVEPSVIAYGLMEATPSWDFTAHPQAPLVGSRFVYIIVQKPKGSGPLTANLRIVVNVAGPRGMFRAALKTETGDSLSVVACER